MDEPRELTLLEACKEILHGRPDRIVKFVLAWTTKRKAWVENRHGITLRKPKEYVGDAWSELCEPHKRGPHAGESKKFVFRDERGIYGILKNHVGLLILRDTEDRLGKRIREKSLDGTSGGLVSGNASSDVASVVPEQLRVNPEYPTDSPYGDASQAVVHELIDYFRRRRHDIDQLAAELMIMVISDVDRFVGATGRPSDGDRKAKLDNAELADALGVSENKISKVKKRIRDVCELFGLDFRGFLEAVERVSLSGDTFSRFKAK